MLGTKKEKVLHTLPSTSNDELRNLYYGNWLMCKACGKMVWGAGMYVNRERFTFDEVTDAYYAHAKECFGLQRLIVQHRRDFEIQAKAKQEKPLPPPPPPKKELPSWVAKSLFEM